MTVEEILSRFDNVEGGNGRWTARCPAHEDSRNSLSIGVREDDGAVLLNCHANCEKSGILQGAGLQFRDLFPQTNGSNGHHHTNGSNGNASGKGRGKLVVTYDYRDASGELQFQACRFEPKNFIQRRPDGSGGWIYNLQGVRHVPYHLPALLAAVDEPVYIVEGEKDVNALASLGLVATTNAGGAGKWRNEFSDWLQDRDVYIVPDNDEPGEKHARQVAASAHGKAASVRIVRLPNLPDKADVTDWLAAGGTKDGLLALCEAAEVWTPAEAPAATPKRPRKPRPVNIVQAEGRTDLANAERLVEAYGNRLRFCHPWRKYLVWDGRRWKIDDDGEAHRIAKLSAKQLWKDAQEADNLQAVRDLAAFAGASCSRRGIENALALASSEHGIPILPAELDADPWLLNCDNGTLDLRTGKLRPHDPADRITKLCPTTYDPDACSPEWERFLGMMFTPEVLTFAQRFCGYGLTGDVREQVLPIWWGTGSNGKSTFFNAFTEAMGSDYAIKADKSLIVAQKHTGHSTERMDLFGMRFVIASETEDGERLAESQIKDLTGGEVIRGRRMREDSWEYRPTHKIILATNHKPEINGQDHAIWRRLRLIPFDTRFWDADKGETGPSHLRVDKTLAEKFKAAHPAILAWAVRGCLEWQRDGLTSPEAINIATAEYRSDSDRLGAFIDERCFIAPQVSIRSGKLFDDYRAWCEENGEEPLSRTRFGKRIRETYRTEKSNGVWYRGIALQAADE